jgi:hypothetical protein
MTDSEAKERAMRIVTLQLPAELLTQTIAREFQSIARECGWQKEHIGKVQKECDERIRRALNIIKAEGEKKTVRHF